MSEAVPSWAVELLREGRVQVVDYLQESAAERLHLCLSEQVEWTLALRDAEGPRTLAASDYAALSPPQRTAFFAEIAASASGNQYRFAYDSYMIVRAVKEGWTPNLLHGVLEFLNTPEFLSFARRLTGEPGINAVTAQGTRYRGGQFLTGNRQSGRHVATGGGVGCSWRGLHGFCT